MTQFAPPHTIRVKSFSSIPRAVCRFPFLFIAMDLEKFVPVNHDREKIRIERERKSEKVKHKRRDRDRERYSEI